MASTTKKKKRGTKNEAIAVALLKRAAKRIEDSVELPDLKPGAYTGECTVSLSGTVTVGESAGPVTVPKVDNAEMLGGLVQLCQEYYPEDFDLEQVGSDLVELLVEDPSDVKAELDSFREIVAGWAEEYGHTKTTAGRKGAVTGSPWVRIVGESGESSVELELNGGSA